MGRAYEKLHEGSEFLRVFVISNTTKLFQPVHYSTQRSNENFVPSSTDSPYPPIELTLTRPVASGGGHDNRSRYGSPITGNQGDAHFLSKLEQPGHAEQCGYTESAG